MLISNNYKTYIYNDQYYLVTQVQNEQGQYGGWTDNPTMLTKIHNAWIESNVYLLNSSISEGVHIKGNSLLINSTLTGRIKADNVTIVDSNINSVHGLIKKDTTIINKQFNFNFSIDNRITNCDNLYIYNKYGLYALYNEWYCKLGCKILTWKEALAYIQDAQENILQSSLYKYLLQELGEYNPCVWNQIIQDLQIIIKQKIEQGN